MSEEIMNYGAVVLVFVVCAGLWVAGYVIRRRPKSLNSERYESKWRAIQNMLKDSAQWLLAIIDADKLLEEALKTRKYRGKTMGERLVAAQRDISQNDMVWYGHKLRNKLVHEPDVKLNKTDVRDALIGIKSALKDLGAFDEK